MSFSSNEKENYSDESRGTTKTRQTVHQWWMVSTDFDSSMIYHSWSHSLSSSSSSRNLQCGMVVRLFRQQESKNGFRNPKEAPGFI